MSELKKARILLYDIETTPLVTYTWGTYQQDAIKVIQEWYILCFAYKWLGEKKTHVVSLPDFKLYKKDPKNDYEVVKKLHDLMNEANVVIAHNGDKFDNKKSNARFSFHDLPPPTYHRTVDTLKIARKYFSFTSNRLDALGDHLKLGRKVQTGGFDLWLGCMSGDIKAWNRMARYNKQDVDLLEQVYYRLRPWIENHPSMALLLNRPESCPKCGSGPLHVKDYKTTKTGRFVRLRCQNCGGVSQHRTGEKINKPLYVN